MAVYVSQYRRSQRTVEIRYQTTYLCLDESDDVLDLHRRVDLVLKHHIRGDYRESHVVCYDCREEDVE